LRPSVRGVQLRGRRLQRLSRLAAVQRAGGVRGSNGRLSMLPRLPRAGVRSAVPSEHTNQQGVQRARLVQQPRCLHLLRELNARTLADGRSRRLHAMRPSVEFPLARLHRSLPHQQRQSLRQPRQLQQWRLHVLCRPAAGLGAGVRHEVRARLPVLALHGPPGVRPVVRVPLRVRARVVRRGPRRHRSVLVPQWLGGTELQHYVQRRDARSRHADQNSFMLRARHVRPGKRVVWLQYGLRGPQLLARLHTRPRHRLVLLRQRHLQRRRER